MLAKSETRIATHKYQAFLETLSSTRSGFFKKKNEKNTITLKSSIYKFLIEQKTRQKHFFACYHRWYDIFIFLSSRCFILVVLFSRPFVVAYSFRPNSKSTTFSANRSHVHVLVSGKSILFSLRYIVGKCIHCSLRVLLMFVVPPIVSRQKTILVFWQLISLKNNIFTNHES